MFRSLTWLNEKLECLFLASFFSISDIGPILAMWSTSLTKIRAMTCQGQTLAFLAAVSLKQKKSFITVPPEPIRLGISVRLCRRHLPHHLQVLRRRIKS